MPRLSRENRRKVIVKAAVDLSVEQQNIHNWTREDVASKCSVETSAETVKHYFPAIDDLRKEAGNDPATKSCVNLFDKK